MTTTRAILRAILLLLSLLFAVVGYCLLIAKSMNWIGPYDRNVDPRVVIAVWLAGIAVGILALLPKPPSYAGLVVFDIASIIGYAALLLIFVVGSLMVSH